MSDTSSSNFKQVRFGDLTIREYPMVLGEHPNCSSGVPVQIGWEPQSVSTRNLELYEYMRGERRHGKRQLCIPVQKRAQLLLRNGCSLEEIGAATLQVAETKKNRAETLRKTGWDRANIMLEKTGALPKGILNGVTAFLVKPKKHTVQARMA
jgi:hypothetical protein